MDEQKKIISRILNLLDENSKKRSEVFLTQTLESIKDGSFDKRFTAKVIRHYFLQGVTRDNQRRRKVFCLLVLLLETIGKEEALAFDAYIKTIDEELNAVGRSFFDKL